jgi:polyisoprenoid-binding protein YceI
MGITWVRGKFGKFTVEGDFNEETPERSTLEVKIDVASIDTKMDARDAHLRSPDFFDAERYPTIVFKGKRGEILDSNRGRLIGDLTVKDVTREVVLEVEHTGQAKTPWGTMAAGFTAQGKINRKDWGLNWNKALESGGWLVGDDVKIDVEIEFNKAPEPQPAKDKVAPQEKAAVTA